MNAPGDAAEDYDLSNTLTKALAQTQLVLKRLSDESTKVEKLTLENEELRVQLQEIRAQSQIDDIQKAYDLKVQELFQRDIEKQIQIDELTKKLLRAEARERKSRQSYPLLSSPVSSSAGLSSRPHSPGVSHGPGLSHAHPAPSDSVAITRAQRWQPENTAPRSPTPADVDTETDLIQNENLLSLDHNAKIQRPSSEDESKNLSHIKNEEDNIGVVHTPDQSTASGHQQKDTDTSTPPPAENPKKRLDALLSASASTHTTLPRAPLTRTSLSSPLRHKSPTEPQVPLTNVPKPPATLLSGAKPPVPIPSSIQNYQTTRSSFLPQKRKHIPGPEDEEPFRARPIHRLNLTHFKPNFSATSTTNHLPQNLIPALTSKCLPGCTRPECCGTLLSRTILTSIGSANNAPSNPKTSFISNTNEQDEENELLLSFLGPGSSSKISTLTNLARENLLHEARAKKWADVCVKRRPGVNERAASPPGFWDTEMPGSQEEKENRERVRVLEREEVARRYREALREGGRWVFADE